MSSGDPHSHATTRQHSVLHRAQEVLVERHRLVIAGRSELDLGLETLPLYDRSTSSE